MPHLTKSSLHICMMCLTIFTALVFAPSSQAAAAWYVSPNGSDSNSCTAPAQPCLSINQAIRLAAKGATIFVAAGTYPNPAGVDVKIDQDVALSGGWNAQFTSQAGYSTVTETGETSVYGLYGLEVPSGVTASAERFVIQPEPSVGYFHSSGIYNAGVFTLRDSMVQGHHGYQSCGGIYNSGQMTIIHSTIQRNTHEYYNCGGIEANQQSTLTIIDSLIDQNSAGMYGSGIYVNPNAVVTIRNSVISANQGAGQVTAGGGLFNAGGMVRLENSVITGNSVNGKGGGIFSSGKLDILNSTVKDNTSGETGGGMYLASATTSITNSTISTNSDTAGASIYSDTSTLDIRSSTISNNATAGIAVFGNGPVTMRNSILANNGGAGSGLADCTGPIQSAGYNLLGSTAGCTFLPAAGDLQNVDPKISLLVETLGYNPLAAGSPAVNAGNPAGCTDPAGSLLTADQRGAARAARCDIGAYEYTAPGSPTRIYPVSGNNQNAAVNTIFDAPLSALVVDAAGSPVDHTNLTFAAPDSGPSLIFATSQSNTAAVLTDAWGTAVSPKFTANLQPGSYPVSTSAGAFRQNDTFSLANIGGTFLPVLSSCSPDFLDDFSNPASGWLEGEDANMMVRYSNGEYQVMTKTANILYLLKSPTCDGLSYSVETDVHWYSGTGNSYGIIFGMQGKFNKFYLFEVNADYQQYRLTYFTGSDFYPIVPPTSSDLIQGYTGTNHLKVTFSGGSITLSINQNDVWSGTDASVTGMSYAGITVTSYQDQSNADARFDNFRQTFLYTGNAQPMAAPLQKLNTGGNRIPPPARDWTIPKERITR